MGHRSFRLFNTKRVILPQESGSIYDAKEQIVRLPPPLRNVTEREPIAQVVFSADLKDTLYNCSICESAPTNVLVYLLAYSAMKVYKAYAAIEMNTDAFICHETWQVVIDTLIQRYWFRNGLQEAHGIVTQTTQKTGPGHTEN